MLIDSCMAQLFGKSLDRNGAVAQRGIVVREVVSRLLREKYFSTPPPKSCGREEYGEAYTTKFIAMCRKADAKDSDIIATATALTAESIQDAYRRFVWPHLVRKAPMARAVEYVVAGGGAKNATLMAMLRSGLEPLGVNVRDMGELGIPAQAKEAVAFALLAWLTWNNLPGNVPSATGAARPVVLGKVTNG
jgi:anhydro-N-acetylmuramic acid kinase